MRSPDAYALAVSKMRAVPGGAVTEANRPATGLLRHPYRYACVEVPAVDDATVLMMWRLAKSIDGYLTSNIHGSRPTLAVAVSLDLPAEGEVAA